MAQNKLHITVFLSSPSDLKEERDAAEQVASELNRMYSPQKAVHIEILRWENFARPAFGERVQEVINTQTPEGYDIFVGLLGKRFGTATGIYGSGTEEEFERAFARLQDSKVAPQIMFYFKNGPMEFENSTELEQFKAVLGFKEKLASKGGLYWEYKTADQFEAEFRIHLAKATETCIQQTDGISPSAVCIQISAQHNEHDPSEDGFFDYLENAETKLAEATALMDEIAALQAEHTKRLNIRTEAMKAAADSPDSMKTIKEQIKWTSQDLEQQAVTLRPKAEGMANAYAMGLESSSKAVAFAVQTMSPKKQELEKLFSTFKTTTGQMKEYRSSLSEMKGSMMALPRFSNQFNTARRHLKHSIEYLESRLDMLIVQSNGFLASIEEQLRGSQNGGSQNGSGCGN